MADDELDEAVRRADPDRWLASRFIADREARADVVALYAFDNELARAGRLASNPLIAEIRLTWWREALDEIFGGKPVRRHPTATALARAVRGHSLPRAPLEAMIDARIDTLQTTRFELDAAHLWADAVGGSAAVLAARRLDLATDAEAARPAGHAWGLFRLGQAGLAAGDDFDRGLKEALGQADRAARSLSAAAYPAAVHATLARAGPSDGQLSGVTKRARLVWAMMRGRL